MPKEVKPGPSIPHAPESSFVSLLSGWVQQGVESFFATQRILLDLAMRQNASAMKILRDQFSDPRYSPVSILTELAGEGTANFIETQRILLDLAQRENEIVMGGVKERVGAMPGAGAIADMVRRSVDTFVEMQQEYLTIVSKQAQSWLTPAKGGKRYDPASLVTFAREAMDNFVTAQKKFLDVIADETAKATSGKAETKTAKKTEMYELARAASESFYDAQKKLLDVASQQMNVNLKTLSRGIDMVTPIRLRPVADLTNEGVKSFVAAEKALIDSMVKPRPAHAAPKAEARPRRKSKTAKTAAQAAGVSA